MKICLLVVGKTADRELDRLIARYEERIKHYAPFDVVVIPDVKSAKGRSETKQKDDEGKEILAFILPTDLAVLLDEKGESLTSRGFSDRLQKAMLAGYKRMLLIVGGPYGFSSAVYQAVPTRISLSAMTFSHRMVRLFAIEQVYRALTILAGEPYHHD